MTLLAIARPWQTGALVVDDSVLGPETGPGFFGTVNTVISVSGTHNLNAAGGNVSLVTPQMLAIHGVNSGHRAGYARLELSFAVPEPRLGAALAALARQRARP